MKRDIWALVVVAASLVAGLLLGRDLGRGGERSAAIKANAGRWVVNASTGETKFVYGGRGIERTNHAGASADNRSRRGTDQLRRGDDSPVDRSGPQVCGRWGTPTTPKEGRPNPGVRAVGVGGIPGDVPPWPQREDAEDADEAGAETGDFSRRSFLLEGGPQGIGVTCGNAYESPPFNPPYTAKPA